MPKLSKSARQPRSQTKMGGATITLQRANQPGRVASVVMRKDGKRVRIKHCATQMEAKAIFDTWTIEVTNAGTAAASLITDADKRAVADFYQRVAGWQSPPSLADALRQYFQDHERSAVGLTVADAADAQIHSLERRGLSKRHIDGTRVRLARFTKKFGKRRLNSVQGEEIARWLHGLQLSAVSQRNFRLAISPLFTDAVKRGELDRNPLATVKPPKDRTDCQPEIFSPAEVTRFMQQCPERIRAAMAIQFFSGLRSAEVLRLTWDKVNLLEGHIDISAGVAKTAARRLVEITPNLQAWLAPLAKSHGPVSPLPDAYRYQLDAYREAIGFQWKDNGSRHSFISYLMASRADAAFVANQAGNSPAVIHRNYKALVTKREAENYFNITPDAGEKVIPMPARQAAS